MKFRLGLKEIFAFVALAIALVAIICCVLPGCIMSWNQDGHFYEETLSPAFGFCVPFGTVSGPDYIDGVYHGDAVFIFTIPPTAPFFGFLLISSGLEDFIAYAVLATIRKKGKRIPKVLLWLLPALGAFSLFIGALCMLGSLRSIAISLLDLVISVERNMTRAQYISTYGQGAYNNALMNCMSEMTLGPGFVVPAILSFISLVIDLVSMILPTQRGTEPVLQSTTTDSSSINQ